MRSYPRTTMAIALLAAGWINTAAAGAMAEEYHGVAGKAAVDPAAATAAPSDSGNSSASVPVIVGNDGDGHPVIEYHGSSSGAAAPGGKTVSAGIPVVVGSDGEGHPVIEYRGSDSRSGLRNGGVPVITGADGDGHPKIAYLHASPGGVNRSPTEPGR